MRNGGGKRWRCGMTRSPAWRSCSSVDGGPCHQCPLAIVGLFTQTYVASVPIFMVGCAMLPGVLAVDAVLRVYAPDEVPAGHEPGSLRRRRRYDRVFLNAFGLLGAVGVTALAMAVVKVMASSASLSDAVGVRERAPWGA